MKYTIVLFLIVLKSACFAQSHDLNFFIQQAKQNSPVLKDLQNQILSNRIDSQLLRASLGTQVNFLSTDSYAPIIKGWGYDEAITNIANVSGLVQANRNFLTRNNIASQYRTIALQ